MTPLHFGEYRRFPQPATQIHRNQPKNATDKEGNTPREGDNIDRREDLID
jgi:hypothetical protein